MMHVLLRFSSSFNIFTNIIIMLMSYHIGNAQDVGKYLDVGDGSGVIEAALSKGFHPGGSIVINGTVNLNPRRFFINLEDDSGSKIYLHINPRFDEKIIVYSHKVNDDWRPGYDQTASNLTGLSPNTSFEITVLCNATGYMININTKPCYFYNHRFDTSIIRNIKFAGDVTISSVLYIPGNHSCLEGGCRENEECVVVDGPHQLQCQCIDGYSGPLCQDSCKVTSCTGNNVCVYFNEKYACRSRIDLTAIIPSIQCRHPYVAVDTECVLVVMARLNWDAARFRCLEIGGFLMEPDFPINFKQYISNNYPENDNTGFWMGGADRGLHRWVWVSSLNDVQEDFPWGPGEPNDLQYSSIKEDCMNLYTHSGRSYFYNDAHCSTDIFYICEAHPLVTPTAAARVGEQISPDQSSLYMILQIQVAMLLLLIIAMIGVVVVIIYNNFYVIKKAYGSFGPHSISFRNQFAEKLNADDDT